MSVLTAERSEMCYCPGCSHGGVLEQLGRAIDCTGLPPQRVCIVSDIGCIGTADRYFACHTFHGLHGRSITYAEGISRARLGMLVVVLIGDGGCGIGTAHLVHAARRNADIKVVVCNNFNFGMTGGQHSSTTPPTMMTATTPGGAVEQPFDVCRTVAVNGAAYAGRFSAFDPELGDHLLRAFAVPGFVLVDIWELCTAYFVPANKLNRASLQNLSDRFEMPFGVLQERCGAVPAARREADRREPASAHEPACDSVPIMHWPGRTEICVAGSAGQRIRSAVGAIGSLAVSAGLYAAQQDDFPITVRRGFSLSNLIVSNTPIRYTGVDRPDIVVVLSADGLARMGSLANLDCSCRIFAVDDLPPDGLPATAERVNLQLLEKRVGKPSVALALLAFVLVRTGLVESGLFYSVAHASLRGSYRQAHLDALSAGLELAAGGSRAAAQR